MVSPPPVDHLVVLSHPDPNSFCASVARCWQEEARKNHQTCGLRDLYADGFDPVLKANEQPGKPGYAPLAENIEERRRLEALDVLVLVYPIWFGTPPAMMKGYLERVVGSGVSIAQGATQDQPLRNVRLVQIWSSATSDSWLAEVGIRGALHTIFDRYVGQVFGAKEEYRLHLDLIREPMSQQHAATLFAQVRELADHVCAEANAERWQAARRGQPRKTGDG